MKFLESKKKNVSEELKMDNQDKKRNACDELKMGNQENSYEEISPKPRNIYRELEILDYQSVLINTMPDPSTER